MTTDHKALIAEAREAVKHARANRYGPVVKVVAMLAGDLADALEAATVERAVVEAQAIEQAAELCAQIEADTEYDGPRENDISYAVTVLRARAEEIRQAGSDDANMTVDTDPALDEYRDLIAFLRQNAHLLGIDGLRGKPCS